MTVKEKTSDGLISKTEQTPTTKQLEETNSEPQLNHRTPMEQEEPNYQPRLAHFGLGFPHTRRGHLASPRDSLGSRSLSSEASRLHDLISGCGCITLKMKTRSSATPVHERTQFTPAGHVNVRCSLHHQRPYQLERFTRKKAGFSQHEKSQWHREAVERSITLHVMTNNAGEHISSSREEDNANNKKAIVKSLSNIRFLVVTSQLLSTVARSTQ